MKLFIPHIAQSSMFHVLDFPVRQGSEDAVTSRRRWEWVDDGRSDSCCKMYGSQSGHSARM